MKRTISFIGAGNMGGAIVKAVCKKIDPSQVIVFDPNQAAAAALSALTGCAVAADAAQAVREAHYVTVCVKPQIFDPVFAGLLPEMQSCAAAGDSKSILSIASGVTIARMEKALADAQLQCPVFRIIPNMPVTVGAGLFLITPNALATDAEKEELSELFEMGGLVEFAPESMLGPGGTLYSAAPAFIYMVIEALADGGVMTGVPRAQALRFAAQGVLGAASMVLGTGEHPGALKDAVCSPGGVTIAGVAALEKNGLRSAMIEAVLACDAVKKANSK